MWPPRLARVGFGPAVEVVGLAEGGKQDSPETGDGERPQPAEEGLGGAQAMLLPAKSRGCLMFDFLRAKNATGERW